MFCVDAIVSGSLKFSVCGPRLISLSENLGFDSICLLMGSLIIKEGNFAKK